MGTVEALLLEGPTYLLREADLRYNCDGEIGLSLPGVGGHFNHFLPLSKASISATKNRGNEGLLEKFVLVQ